MWRGVVRSKLLVFGLVFLFPFQNFAVDTKKPEPPEKPETTEEPEWTGFKVPGDPPGWWRDPELSPFDFLGMYHDLRKKVVKKKKKKFSRIAQEIQTAWEHSLPPLTVEDQLALAALLVIVVVVVGTAIVLTRGSIVRADVDEKDYEDLRCHLDPKRIAPYLGSLKNMHDQLDAYQYLIHQLSYGPRQTRNPNYVYLAAHSDLLFERVLPIMWNNLKYRPDDYEIRGLYAVVCAMAPPDLEDFCDQLYEWERITLPELYSSDRVKRLIERGENECEDF